MGEIFRYVYLYSRGEEVGHFKWKKSHSLLLLLLARKYVVVLFFSAEPWRMSYPPPLIYPPSPQLANRLTGQNMEECPFLKENYNSSSKDRVLPHSIQENRGGTRLCGTKTVAKSFFSADGGRIRLTYLIEEGEKSHPMRYRQEKTIKFKKKKKKIYYVTNVFAIL
jgi:hypothetical protein